MTKFFEEIGHFVCEKRYVLWKTGSVNVYIDYFTIRNSTRRLS